VIILIGSGVRKVVNLSRTSSSEVAMLSFDLFLRSRAKHGASKDGREHYAMRRAVVSVAILRVSRLLRMSPNRDYKLKG
jgi:hypothetical protein